MLIGDGVARMGIGMGVGVETNMGARGKLAGDSVCELYRVRDCYWEHMGSESVRGELDGEQGRVRVRGGWEGGKGEHRANA